MFIKDRYSVAFTLFIGGVVLSLLLFKFKNKIPAAAAIAIGIIGIIYLAYLYFQKARLHLTPNQQTITTIHAKTETGCKFRPIVAPKSIVTNIDGVKIGTLGKRFKAVNGADIGLNANNQFYPLGFGSVIMQYLGNGGEEPKSIQNDECWN